MSADIARRPLLLAAGSLGLLLAGGCASSPPRQWHRLPLDAPGSGYSAAVAAPTVATPSTTTTAAATTNSVAVWELVSRVALPAYLDREEMMLDAGDGRVELLARDRWAEPLAEAVPRLLLHDLARLRGKATVWLAPAPPQAGASLRLRVQVLALQAEPAQGRIRLQARWSFEGAGVPPRVGSAALQAPLTNATPPAVVVAHRQVLWQLAREIAADGA